MLSLPRQNLATLCNWVKLITAIKDIPQRSELIFMRGWKWLPKNIIATISSIRRLLFYENRILCLKESNISCTVFAKCDTENSNFLSNPLDVVYNYFWEGKKNKLIFISAIGGLENVRLSPKVVKFKRTNAV